MHAFSSRAGVSSAWKLGVKLARRVLWCDEHYAALDKPALVTVQGGNAKKPAISSKDTLRALSESLTGYNPAAQDRLRIVHRLDRPTSGVLLLARSALAARAIQPLFDAKTDDGYMKKKYLAVCTFVAARVGEAMVEGFRGVVDMSIVERDGLSFAVPPEIAELTSDAKEARTEFLVLCRTGDHLLVEFCPLTGRRHQIRAHAANALGLHIIGDTAYVPEGLVLPSKQKQQEKHVDRLQLHAASLSFAHPLISDAPLVNIQSRIPEDIRKVCQRLNLTLPPLVNHIYNQP